MRRRDLLAALFAPPVDYRDYSRVLPGFLSGLAAQAYRRRADAIDAITTREQVLARQQWVRDTFWKLTGGEPERTPLKARVTGAFDRAAYRVEKILYDSRPEFTIPANLYIPKAGRPPYPAVLFQMGHSLNGKASSLYQFCCQGLAQLGFLVLAFDPMGQGERTYYPREGANLTRLSSADDEHTVPGKQLLLTGDTSTRLQVWDAIRSLDYLASHPLADPSRLASTGNSGGGTLTMLLAAVDDRLACAAPVCPNSENLACANFNPPGSTDDAEQNFVGAAPLGFDRWDTLYPLAPKPLLIAVSAKDFYGTYSPRYIENGREEFARLQRIYRLLGKPDNVKWHESPLPHGLSHDMRMEVYAWFRRHLQGIDEPLAQEPPVQAEADDTLYASPTGNVVRDLKGHTPRQLALSNIRRDTHPANWRGLLALDQPVGRTATRGTTVSRKLKIDAVEVESAPGIWIPAWVYRPPKSSGTMIILEPAGRNTSWNEEGLYQRVAALGWTVIAPDIRGIGDLRPEYPRHSPRHAVWHQAEDAYAWASLMLGKPLLGQRVTDLLAIRRAYAPQGAVIAARGPMSVPALFTALLDSRISELRLAGGLVSYRSLLNTEEYAEPFANFIPGVLRHGDLPDVRESLRRRGATLRDAVKWTAAELGSPPAAAR